MLPSFCWHDRANGNFVCLSDAAFGWGLCLASETSIENKSQPNSHAVLVVSPCPVLGGRETTYSIWSTGLVLGKHQILRKRSYTKRHLYFNFLANNIVLPSQWPFCELRFSETRKKHLEIQMLLAFGFLAIAKIMVLKYILKMVKSSFGN